MHNRADIVDANFSNFVTQGRFPQARSQHRPEDVGLTPEQWVDLFETQVMARQLDLMSRHLRTRNESFYTIGSSGHEANAAIAYALRPNDMAFLHYRDAAFFIQRAKQVDASTPLYDMLLSFAASAEDPISSGRHKVLGSAALSIPPQTSTIASHLPKAVGAALSIQKGADLGCQSRLSPDSLIIASMGDASLNHSTTQGALQSACWSSHQNIPVPLLVVCEDNGLGISVNTPKDWVRSTMESRPQMAYIACDGLNLLDVYQKSCLAEMIAREQRKPVFLHFQCVRLLGHAGSDVESEYLSRERIEASEFNDPLLHSARDLIEQKVLSAQSVIELYQSVKEQVACVAELAIQRPRLNTAEKVMADLVPSITPKLPPLHPDTVRREEAFGREWKLLSKPQHMAKLLNWGLKDIMLRYSNSILFGEDVAQKGGVYHVTAGLWKCFGSKRVFNSPLDEQSILGTAIGMAHNGLLPIPEIQFLAYLHNAEDQLRGEAATLSFFSSSQFTNPMVIRIAGLAYQKGFGGHFHNDNSLAVLRDIPGIIIACPSRGDDAVKMLRACVKKAATEGRVCVFVEPIALYMTKDLSDNNDKGWSFAYPDINEEIAPGDIGVHGNGKDIVIITYGNGHYLSCQAAKRLQDEFNIEARIIDLRWIAPLNKTAIAKAAEGYKNVLIVEECRETGSLSEAIVTLLVESLPQVPHIERVAALDSFIPLGAAANLVLPSADDIVEKAHKMVKKSRNLKAV